MEFEDLQKIWDTQKDAPAFSIDDSRLAVGLYQQREHSRRRLFRKEFAPLYFTMPILAMGSAFLFVAFLGKTLARPGMSDPSMTVWDGMALALAFGSAIAVMVSAHIERRKHEQTQNVFAPTLREELERGISQLDFERSVYSTARTAKLLALIAIGSSVMVWEAGRLNGEPTPWRLFAINLLLILFTVWLANAANKAAKAKNGDRVMQRRRALESMLAALDDDSGARR